MVARRLRAATRQLKKRRWGVASPVTARCEREGVGSRWGAKWREKRARHWRPARCCSLFWPQTVGQNTKFEATVPCRCGEFGKLIDWKYIAVTALRKNQAFGAFFSLVTRLIEVTWCAPGKGGPAPSRKQDRADWTATALTVPERSTETLC